MSRRTLEYLGQSRTRLYFGQSRTRLCARASWGAIDEEAPLTANPRGKDLRRTDPERAILHRVTHAQRALPQPRWLLNRASNP